MLCILKDVIREEKHIEYLLGDEEEEFLYICRSISELKVLFSAINQISVINYMYVMTLSIRDY